MILGFLIIETLDYYQNQAGSDNSTCNIYKTGKNVKLTVTAGDG